MKRILILTSVMILAAAAAGCERCGGGLFRGARLFGPEPAAVYDACPTDACDSCGDMYGTCGTAAPATILPGPETYAPAPIQ